jgi:peptide/nickel transport system substrate-binding protein
VISNDSGGTVRNSALRGTTSTHKLLAVLLTVVVVLAACSDKKSNSSSGASSSASDTTKPVYGGSVTYAQDAEDSGGLCLPEAQLDAAGINYARTIYDTLTVPNAEGKYVPFLAQSVTKNADATVWTIVLRQGVKFHDGTPLTATVVKNNLDAYRGKYAKRSPLLFVFVFDDVTDVKVVDNMTVEVDMKTPWASFPAHLYEYGRLGIMAQKQLDDGKNCFSDMIGTGPFQLLNGGSWQVNDHLTVVKNPNYWRKDSFGQKLPYLDSITFKPVPDGTQQLNGYKSKTFDLGNSDDTTTVIPGLLPDVKAGSFHLAVAKQFPEVGYTIFNTLKEPFNNIHARKAWVYAFNSDLYNKTRNADLNDQANGPFGPGGREVQAGDRQEPQLHAEHPQRLCVTGERAGRRRLHAGGRHEGEPEAGGAVAGDQRRHCEQLPSCRVAQPPRLRP